MLLRLLVFFFNLLLFFFFLFSFEFGLEDAVSDDVPVKLEVRLVTFVDKFHFEEGFEIAVVWVLREVQITHIGPVL
jgi:hypothetical protein